MYFLTWVTFSVIVGIAAGRQFNRDGAGWTMLSLLVSPLITFLLLLALGPKGAPRPPAPPVDLSNVRPIRPPVQVSVETSAAYDMRGWLILTGVIVALVATLMISNAMAAEQSRVYGPDGRSIGTIVPLGDGSSRFFDARGNSRGTSTTSGNTTKDYDARGNVLGTTTAPRSDRWR
jgi:YD repeat-containing protein